VIYIPPGQQGFGRPLQATGWLRGTPQLTAALTRLGVPASASLPAAAPSSAVSAPAAAPKPDHAAVPAWLIATVASAVAIAGITLWLRRSPRPAADRPVTDRPATQETSEPAAVRNEDA
jgi:hypothetical protein